MATEPLCLHRLPRLAVEEPPGVVREELEPGELVRISPAAAQSTKDCGSAKARMA
jgi:hypothetical protein